MYEVNDVARISNFNFSGHPFKQNDVVRVVEVWGNTLVIEPIINPNKIYFNVFEFEVYNNDH